MKSDPPLPLKIYRPSNGGTAVYAIAVLIGLAVGLIDRGTSIFSSISGVIGTGLGLAAAAYVCFFGTRWWVYLYEEHLEIHPRLAKLILDKLGVSLYTPRTIKYQRIREIRWTHGLGWFNELQFFLAGNKSAAGITRHGVQNYADLEKELLQRIPATCGLTGVEFSEGKVRLK
jgi:hypothetical protein